MNLDADPREHAAGRVLYGASEGIAGCVVAHDQPGTGVDRVDGLIGSQQRAAAFIATTGSFAAAIRSLGSAEMLAVGALADLGRFRPPVSLRSQFSVQPPIKSPVQCNAASSGRASSILASKILDFIL